MNFLSIFPEDVDGLGHLSSTERKKERQRIKKLKAKESAEKNSKEEEDCNAVTDGEGVQVPSKDLDPSGEKFLQGDFIQEAATWCSFFTNRTSFCSPETLTRLCEVMLRRWV